jgi:hypothetical protein
MLYVTATPAGADEAAQAATALVGVTSVALGVPGVDGVGLTVLKEPSTVLLWP